MVPCANAQPPDLLHGHPCVPANAGNVLRFAGSSDPAFLAQQRQSHSKTAESDVFYCFLLVAFGF